MGVCGGQNGARKAVSVSCRVAVGNKGGAGDQLTDEKRNIYNLLYINNYFPGDSNRKKYCSEFINIG
jgi:hypothetical protein